ncbi:MAG TPA: hypothetical protein DHW82_06020 [Spirochaetia bacterium]|nr:MAG: hypothetical protein A2Y41_09675 [Spirochaetes bacterium GWB1_36_13]HCL56550.1 hypothetical protein [Spirochaetia bacterium]
MIREALEEKKEFTFSGSFDLVTLKKENSRLIFEKIKSGKNSFIYFFVFFIFSGLVFYYMNSESLFDFTFQVIAVRILVLLLFLSSTALIFLKYHSVIDLEKKEINLFKKYFFFKIKKTYPFQSILAWDIRSGEMGYQLYFKIGESFILFNRILERKTLVRISKYEEAEELLPILKEICVPK